MNGNHTCGSVRELEQLLFVNSCVRGEKSRTLQLARRFLTRYQALHPDTVVTEVDVCAQRLPPQYPEVLAERLPVLCDPDLERVRQVLEKRLEVKEH